MTSILDQYITDVEPIEEEPQKVKKVKATKKSFDPDVEEKREQLSILAVLGTIDSYTGVTMSLGDVKKLSAKDVERYHNRYQVTMGNRVTNGLVSTALKATTEIINYLVPIDDKKELCKDLQGNELVKQELNNAAGYVLLKGGRFVALASGLLQIAKHVKIETVNQNNFDKYVNIFNICRHTLLFVLYVLHQRTFSASLGLI
jgi:hypothetical protein